MPQFAYRARNAEGELKRGAASESPPVPPAGLPSSLLERRPDVREAEQNLAIEFHASVIA